MGIMSWDPGAGFSSLPSVRTPRLTIRCEYPDTDLPPTEVTFRLSPSYGLTTGHQVNEWFIEMMYTGTRSSRSRRIGLVSLPSRFGLRRYGG